MTSEVPMTPWKNPGLRWKDPTPRRSLRCPVGRIQRAAGNFDDPLSASNSSLERSNVRRRLRWTLGRIQRSIGRIQRLAGVSDDPVEESNAPPGTPMIRWKVPRHVGRRRRSLVRGRGGAVSPALASRRQKKRGVPEARPSNRTGQKPPTLAAARGPTGLEWGFPVSPGP